MLHVECPQVDSVDELLDLAGYNFITRYVVLSQLLTVLFYIHLTQSVGLFLLKQIRFFYFETGHAEDHRDEENDEDDDLAA